MAQKYEDCKSHSSFKCSLISGSNDVIKTVSQFLFLLPSQGSDLCVCCLYSLINSDFMVMRWKQQLKSQILSRFRSHGKRAIFPFSQNSIKFLRFIPVWIGSRHTFILAQIILWPGDRTCVGRLLCSTFWS